MKELTKVTYTYNIDNELESENTINEYKANALKEGYTVQKSKVDYKVKKDRKTGDIIDENWLTEITLAY